MLCISSNAPIRLRDFESPKSLRDYTVHGACVVWKYYKKTEPLYSLASKWSQETCLTEWGNKRGYVDLPQLRLKRHASDITKILGKIDILSLSTDIDTNLSFFWCDRQGKARRVTKTHPYIPEHISSSIGLDNVSEGYSLEVYANNSPKQEIKSTSLTSEVPYFRVPRSVTFH
ncbi:hypothetical protein STEG23_011340 [Scotinomys teguina]